MSNRVSKRETTPKTRGRPRKCDGAPTIRTIRLGSDEWEAFDVATAAAGQYASQADRVRWAIGALERPGPRDRP